MKVLGLMRSTIFLLLLTACGGSSSGSGSDQGFDLNVPIFESQAIQEVKGGSIKACRTSTLGQMADSFFPDAQWSDFTSTKGNSVVELTGSLSYQNAPADALIQFVVDPIGGFEASYLEINGQPGNLIELGALLGKMCEST